MCSTGPLWTWGGDQVQLEQQGSLWPPPAQHLWHEEGHLIQLQSEGATSKPSVRGFIPSCLWYPGKLKSSMWLLCVNKEGRVEKTPWLFVVYVAWGNVLSAVRPHSMLILEAYRQKFEAGGFVDPGRKSRFQTGAQEKNSPVPSVFAFALLMNGCSLPVSWFCPAYLLNLHKFYFWAIIISRPCRRVGSWGAASSLLSSHWIPELWILLLSRNFVMETIGTKWLHGKGEPPSGFELQSTENNLVISICKGP